MTRVRKLALTLTPLLVLGLVTAAGAIEKDEELHRPVYDVPFAEGGRAPGDDCNQAINVGALPYFGTGLTNCGSGNNYGSGTTCLGSYGGGEDIIFQLDLAVETTIQIHLTTSSTWTGIAIDDQCPPGIPCIAFATGSSGNKSITQLTLQAGSYWIMVDTWPSPTCIPSFNLEIDFDDPPPMGACCACDGTCEIRSEAVCAQGGGLYMGDGTSCTPNPCTQPPANDTCAGAIEIERCTSGEIYGDLTTACNTYNPAVPGPSCTGYSAMGRDLTYVMHLEEGDEVSLFYFGGYDGVVFDESFYIVTDCSDMTTCLIGADATVNTGESIFWTAPYAGTFYLICDAWGTNAGNTFELTYDITCAGPQGACCLEDGSCTITTEDDCAGVWLGVDTACEPNPCPQPFGACCYPDGTCEYLLEADCMTDDWRMFQDCDPNPCEPTPTIEGSWGQIKNTYR